MELIETHLKCVKAELEAVLSSSPLIIRTYTKHLAKAQGKYIRAISVLSAAIRDDESIDSDAIKFAASIELLHLATLVHDDVMDNADSRRGISTLHKEYGHKTAIICGDYLLAVALNLLNDVEDKKAYIDYSISNYMAEVALGELTQHINNGNYNIKVADYLKIVRGKTAALFEASFVAGAMSMKETAINLEPYKKFGHNVGMIFQFIDDCIDFEVDEKSAKKPTQTDFEQGVFTLPLIKSMERAGKKFLALTRLEVNNLVKEYNGVAYTRDKAMSYYKESLELIPLITVNPLKQEALNNILEASMGYLL